MTFKRIPILIAVLAGLLAGLMPSLAGAASLKWHVRSEHDAKISLEFYSQDRDHVWPGDGDVYVIDDFDTHDYTLTCNKGEKICYGAWVRNHSDSYWGSGYDGKEACDTCCFTCGAGDTPTMVLNAE